MEHIAKSKTVTKDIAARMRRLTTILILGLPLTGCMGASLDFFGGDKVDRTISTNTISSGKPATTNSDEATIRNAVSSADLEKLDSSPLPWANASSGSAGVVSSIQEDQNDGLLCRSFSTTRHSYAGIANFNGKTCLLGDGSWHLLAFDKTS
ncbi:RT0821/Lpp0805 family surface protein [Agrobacterium sp. ES01]|uniref:RT0821/Lpp0805 family surface protein n=1 Tax=Agrobacterium sp. ES01 TaxID=3420714 RepID=UPI003D136593